MRKIRSDTKEINRGSSEAERKSIPFTDNKSMTASRLINAPRNVVRVVTS